MTIAAETKPCRKCGLGLPLDSFAKGGRYPLKKSARLLEEVA